MAKEFYKERIKFLTNEIRMNKKGMFRKQVKNFEDLIKRQEKELATTKLERMRRI